MDGMTRYFENPPESKIELINGRLIVGNQIENGLFLLQTLLESWGAEAAVALAPLPIWWDGLRVVYRDELPSFLLKSDSELFIEQWSDWSARSETHRIVESNAAFHSWSHGQARQTVGMDLFKEVEHLGLSLGRDIVMRLGDDGLTPDVYFIANEHLHRQRAYFVDGPADIVAEIVMPQYETVDRVRKFAFYEAGGIPEYWLIDPYQRTFETYRLENGQYRQCFPNDEGWYETPLLPFVKIRPERVWDDSRDAPPWLVVERIESERRKVPKHPNDLHFGDLAFEPRIGLEPDRISFEEFIAWAPESKIEGYDGRIVVAGTEGTRNVLGMLLMTFGLKETLPLLPARLWIEALQRLGDAKEDLRRKADAWERARQAAQILRTRHGVKRVAVVGDLLSDAPWTVWSEAVLVTWEKPDEQNGWTWSNLKEVFGDMHFDSILASEVGDDKRFDLESAFDL